MRYLFLDSRAASEFYCVFHFILQYFTLGHMRSTSFQLPTEENRPTAHFCHFWYFFLFVNFFGFDLGSTLLPLFLLHQWCMHRKTMLFIPLLTCSVSKVKTTDNNELKIKCIFCIFLTPSSRSPGPLQEGPYHNLRTTALDTIFCCNIRLQLDCFVWLHLNEMKTILT